MSVCNVSFFRREKTGEVQRYHADFKGTTRILVWVIIIWYTHTIMFTWSFLGSGLKFEVAKEYS